MLGTSISYASQIATGAKPIGFRAAALINARLGITLFVE